MKSLYSNRRQFLLFLSVGGVAFLSGHPRFSLSQSLKGEKPVYTPKDYNRLLGMVGFSDTILKNHFTLYQGYVTNTNRLLEVLNQMLKEGKTGSPEFAELKTKIRMGIQWDEAP